MNSNQLKKLFCLILLTLLKPGTAQVLLLYGQIKDQDTVNTSGYYELRNACHVLQSGKTSKLKLKLEANDVYTLTFSKAGYQSKSLVISTFNEEFFSYRFSFYVILQSLCSVNSQPSKITAGSIYYDKLTSDYNYIVLSKESFEPQNRKSVTLKKSPEANSKYSRYSGTKG